MAFTVSTPDGVKNQPSVVGQVRSRICDFAVSSYTTGGEPVTAATFGLSKIIGVRSIGQVDATGTQACVAHWASALGTLKLLDGGTQTAAGQARTVRIEVIGF